MRHLKAGRKLGRNATHRLALQRNMTYALISHERITTTVAKAKYLRPFVEKLITLAKKGTLHARRLAISRLGPVAKAYTDPADPTNVESVLSRLFDTLAPRYIDRQGGYTRVLKLATRRLGDAGEKAILELIPAGEIKAARRSAPAAPRVAPTPAPVPAPAPAPEPPPAPTAQEGAAPASENPPTT